MANANEIKKLKKTIIKLTEKREKQLAVLAAIEKDLSEAQAQYTDTLKNETLNRLSKAMFSDHNFTADQIDKLIGLIDQFGTSISDIDPISIVIAEDKESGTSDKKAETEEKVDTNINFSSGDRK